MHHEHLLGMVKHARGQVRSAIGQVFRNDVLRTKGRHEVAQARVHRALGDREIGGRR